MCKSHAVPTARQHNAVLQHLLANRLLKPVEIEADAEPMPHPWQVSASRFESNASSTLDPDKTWRIDVADGYVNDAPASILYQRSNDPRGWQWPSGYVETNPDPSFVERSALDDPDDPPYLVIPDPPSSQLASADPSQSAWQQVTDTQRVLLEGGAFCSATDWDLELWRARVLLSAAPFAAVALNPALPPPRLTRYRLYTRPILPALTFGSDVGGWVELATLYLLRDPANPNDTAEIQVRQREFYDLWAMIITPFSDLLTIPSAGGLIGADVASGTEAAFWSV